MKTISKYFFKLLYSSSLKLFLHSDCTGKAFFAHIKVPWNFILLKVTYTLNKAYKDSKNIKIIWARNVCASCVAAAQKQLPWFFVTRAKTKNVSSKNILSWIVEKLMPLNASMKLLCLNIWQNIYVIHYHIKQYVIHM